MAPELTPERRAVERRLDAAETRRMRTYPVVMVGVAAIVLAVLVIAMVLNQAAARRSLESQANGFRTILEENRAQLNATSRELTANTCAVMRAISFVIGL